MPAETASAAEPTPPADAVAQPPAPKPRRRLVVVAAPASAPPSDNDTHDGSAGHRRWRSRTVSMRHLAREDGAPAAGVSLPVITERPRTRGDCRGAQRPCPWVSCKHHLYLDVDPRTGSIRFNFPDLAPHELTESCALDVAERGGVEGADGVIRGDGITLEAIATLMNVTRERVRQIATAAKVKLKAASPDFDPATSSPDELGALPTPTRVTDEQIAEFEGFDEDALQFRVIERALEADDRDQSNDTIGQLLGVPRSAVDHVRRRLGLPPVREVVRRTQR